MYEIAGYPLKMNKNYHMACSEYDSNDVETYDEIYVWTTCSLLRHTQCIILIIYIFGFLFSNWLIVTKFHQI